MGCVFCEIDKEKTRIVEEDGKVIVILSNPRLVEGHLLVIPKRHVEKLSELDDDEKERLLEKVEKYQEIILKKFAKGCDVRSNYRPFLDDSKLKLSHLHFHLLPRGLEDELYKKSMVHEKDLFKDLTSEEIDKYSEIFRNG